MLSGERNYEMYLDSRDTCYACPISCKSTFANKSDQPEKNLDPVYGGAEYEAMGALGSICDVSDNLAVLKANELCNGYGLDPISAGMSIGFVMECFEHGFITKEDTGGLEYKWGDGEMLVRAVEMIAKREGFGDVMAEGVDRMSKRFGEQTQPFNITVKGQELPMHEPRQKFVLGVGYAVAPVGADHCMNVHDTSFTKAGSSLDRVNSALAEPIGPVPATALNEDKMKIFYNDVNFQHVLDCALICQFYPYDYQQVADMLSGVTGAEYGIQDVIALGARVNTLTRLFNLREGFSADDDRLPRRVMQAFKDGPIAGNEIRMEDFDWAKSRFYEMMGWDAETGVPTGECLERLGIDRLLKR